MGSQNKQSIENSVRWIASLLNTLQWFLSWQCSINPKSLAPCCLYLLLLHFPHCCRSSSQAGLLAVLLGMLSSQSLLSSLPGIWTIPSIPSGLCSNIAFSARPSLTILFKIAILCIVSQPLFLLNIFFWSSFPFPIHHLPFIISSYNNISSMRVRSLFYSFRYPYSRTILGTKLVLNKLLLHDYEWTSNQSQSLIKHNLSET